MFPHVCDVEGRKVVKDSIERGRTGNQNRKKSKGTNEVTYNTYLASGGRLSYTPNVECVVG